MRERVMIRLRACHVFASASILALALCSSATAQERIRPVLSLSAGPSPYDLSGTGTGLAIAGRVALPIQPYLIVEPGLVYFGYTTQFGTDFGFLLLELSVQAVAPLGPVHPYLGAGVGSAVANTGSSGSELTLHVVLGVRLRLTDHWGAVAEGRLRSVDPFHGNMVDLTLGVSWRP